MMHRGKKVKKEAERGKEKGYSGLTKPKEENTEVDLPGIMNMHFFLFPYPKERKKKFMTAFFKKLLWE